MKDLVVVVVELPEGGRGQVVLDSAAGSGGVATAIVVAMVGETGPSNAAVLMCLCVPRDLDSKSLWRRPNRGEIVGRARGGGIAAFLWVGDWWMMKEPLCSFVKHS